MLSATHEEVVKVLRSNTEVDLTVISEAEFEADKTVGVNTDIFFVFLT